ncbi:hypothetical protein HNQ92_003548 [Rhabdobacter roseus]|uniref:3-keto-alpha-glucoside-1,2-lyase/3-keto-2-hydroxy-glucal hydratase domain-containing protein n=1 Tax=Rhabdobacter roseus TaxID=1655419 RepID=A0A840TNU5_9BACT|nr:family 16 glycoside hydrolase [Rhabdobacter roseus]MBB5285391.1 hypothetical protein [Rhabdobacter roseus]
MKLFCRVFLSLLLVLPGASWAQSGNYILLPLQDLSAFEQGTSNWSIKGGLAVSPAKGATPQPGTGVLVGTPGAVLQTRVKAQDLRLRLEFILSPGAEAYLGLPGGQRVRLSDSWQQAALNAQTSGYIGQFPTQNAAKAPGLWQTVELAFDASVPAQAGFSQLNHLALNGVTVQQSVYLPLAKAISGAQPLSLEVRKGTVGFRNIGYQLLANSKPLRIETMAYKLYSDAWDATNLTKLVKEEKTTNLTQEVGTGMREFQVVYEGTLVVDEAGEYRFTSLYSGPRFLLDIDGKSVLATGESTSQDAHSASATLTKGAHPFRLTYSRFPWRPAALGLRVETAGVRPYDLHSLSSLPVPAPKPYLDVAPTTRPELVRSFILLEGEKQKRTHCLSVGNPAGWHYTVDLNRGALLQAWRGQFANVTEMWYERGEPQLLFTAGLTIPLSGKSSLAVLPSTRAAWPDSANLNYLGYRLDAQGVPTLRYQMGTATVSDQVVARPDGLVRTVRTEGTPDGPLYALLAAGSTITLVEKGLYEVDNRYFVRVDAKARALVRDSAGQKELLLPVSGTASYTLFW